MRVLPWNAFLFDASEGDRFVRCNNVWTGDYAGYSWRSEMDLVLEKCRCEIGVVKVRAAWQLLTVALANLGFERLDPEQGSLG
jgi:hypothetical protein